MATGAWHLLVYVLIILFPPLFISIFQPAPLHEHGLFYEIGKNFALTATMILCMQTVLAGRFKWAERPFGFDIVIRFHRNMAILTAGLLLAHPVLIAADGIGWRLLYGIKLPWYIWAGKAALVLLLINAGISLYRKKLNLTFERWRLYHDLIGPTLLVLAFVHSWVVGRNLQKGPLYWLWPLFFLIAAYLFVHHRILRPRRLRQLPFRVIEVTPEAPDVTTVTMVPDRGQRIYSYAPGQFHFITFHRNRDLPEEEHHWTISTSPTETGYIASTIKALGDFTATIRDTRPGDTATVHGPFGRFSHVFHPDEKELVFIAGGIGVTPLRSMLRYMNDTGSDLPVLFLYANENEESIVFRQELDRIATANYPRLKLVHVLENPGKDWTGETGLIDRAKIERLCRDKLHKAGFYVCGPPGLLEPVIRNLKSLGVEDRRIHLEIFSFLD